MSGLPHLPSSVLDTLEDRHRILANILGGIDRTAQQAHYGPLFDAIDAAGQSLWALHLVIRDLRRAADAALEEAGTPRIIAQDPG